MENEEEEQVDDKKDETNDEYQDMINFRCCTNQSKNHTDQSKHNQGSYVVQENEGYGMARGDCKTFEDTRNRGKNRNVRQGFGKVKSS